MGSGVGDVALLSFDDDESDNQLNVFQSILNRIFISSYLKRLSPNNCCTVCYGYALRDELHIFSKII